VGGGIVSFEIPGTPVAKGRARISTRGGKVRSFTPQKTVNFEARVALAASDAMNGQKPIEGPISLFLIVYLPIPQSWPQKKKNEALTGIVKPCSRPDLDNFAKAVCDGCNAIVWKDDSQVTTLTATKRYSDAPGVSVIAEAA
jgi:Holliday junction resolvase RusA-like endonuclease